MCSLRALEKSEVIAYSTLQSAMKAQRMSVGDQKALAAAYGFDIEWREWRDPDPRRAAALHERRDRAEAFLEKFGGDSMPELERNYRSYIESIAQ